jgi:hypothetical protein
LRKGDQGDKGDKGDTGQASLTSFVFRRATSQPATPSGGSYSSPVPTTSGWSDGVPSGTNPLWASKRLFTSDGASPQDSAWSTPQLMADSTDFEVQYSAYASPGTPSTNSSYWSDTASEDSLWMATRYYSNLAWSDWQVVKIKGEGGDDGRGVVQVIVYYTLYSSGTTAPTVPSSASSTPSSIWSTTYKAPSNMPNSKFCWCYKRTQYSADPEWEAEGPFLLAMYATPGTDGEKGAAVRGIPDWGSVAVGFKFLSGASGESFYDVVRYNGYYWRCTTSHTKTSTNYPSSTSSYWTIYEYTDFIATKSLITDGIIMSDDEGNLLFRAEGGVVECNTGKFKDVQVQGDVIVGTYDDTDEDNITAGQRIEIRSDSKAVAVYDSDNQVCAVLDGNAVATKDSIYKSTTGSWTINTSSSTTVSSPINERTDSIAKQSSSAIGIAGGFTLKTTISAASLTISCTGTGTVDGPQITEWSEMRLVLARYNNSACSVGRNTFQIWSGNLELEDDSSKTNTKSFVSSATIYSRGVTNSQQDTTYYYRLEWEFTASAGNRNGYSAYFTYTVDSCVYTKDFYASRIFKNGLLLSKDANNFFLAINETGKGYLDIYAMSNGNGIRIVNGALEAKVSGSTFWGKIPTLLFRAKVSWYEPSSGTIGYRYGDEDNSYKPYYNALSVTPTLTRVNQGWVKLSWSSSIALPIATTIVNAVGFERVRGYGNIDNAMKATIMAQTDYSITIGLTNSNSSNDGAFIIDIYSIG